MARSGHSCQVEMKPDWLDDAYDDLDHIYKYIAEDCGNPTAAARVSGRSSASPIVRHKLFVTGDLMARDRDRSGTGEAPLSFNEPAPAMDVDALSGTLDGLDRLERTDKDERRRCRPIGLILRG